MMDRARHKRRQLIIAAVAVMTATLAALAADEPEVVILKDGFVLQGHPRKEVTMITDRGSGRTFPIIKNNGFDMIDEGPKIVVFSAHARNQQGPAVPTSRLRPKYQAYTRAFPGAASSYPLPAGAVLADAPEFNAQWRRRLKFRTPLGFEHVDQQITYIDPYCIYIVSTTHQWRVAYRTAEMDPALVRRLLSYHPELAAADGPTSVQQRLALAQFMLEAGWLQLAQADLEAIRRDYPGGVPAVAKEAYDSLLRKLHAARAQQVIDEAEAAIAAGRYQYVRELAAAFPTNQAEPRQLDTFTKLLAHAQSHYDRFVQARSVLRRLLDEEYGYDQYRGMIALCGNPVVPLLPRRRHPVEYQELLEAGETVYAELHPDTVERIDTFLTLAFQHARERQQGRDPSHRPAELLAVAVSGWIKGKGGATPRPQTALQLWRTRQMILSYQSATDLNRRNEILQNYTRNQPLGTDEISQILMMLPPAEPENLIFRSGEPVPPAPGIPPGIYRHRTPPHGDVPNGIPYLVKLPPEYHHGRPWPVLLALTHPTVSPEQFLGVLSNEADRHGYILLAPDWANRFSDGWQWNGDDHAYVLNVLRDAVRHFCVDNDRVFLFGYGHGANAAMDIGMSHPDLFAGVAAMSPMPKWTNHFSEYWRNAQNLPFYVITGEQAGEALINVRKIYDQWMPRGYPSLLVVYKGRTLEWFAAEIPTMFDWMNRKRRTVSTSAPTPATRQPFVSIRGGDNRFYWLGLEKIDPRRLIDNVPPGKLVVPATIQGDITGGNTLVLRTLGVQQAAIYLNRETIDWSKPVRVLVNGSLPPGFRPRVIQPSLEDLLEDYRLRGDRRSPVLAKLIVPINP